MVRSASDRLLPCSAAQFVLGGRAASADSGSADVAGGGQPNPAADDLVVDHAALMLELDKETRV